MRLKNFLFFLLSITSISAYEYGIFAGPHFNYINLDLDNPYDLDGYAGGVTSGIWLDTCYLSSKITFEGTWNASRIVGDYCQTSATNEYFLQLEFSKGFFIKCVCIKPYLGFGWDRFENIQEPKTVALKYQYDKLFVPAGVYFQWDRCDESYSLQLEFRPDVWSNLELLSISLDPHWGYGFRGQLIYKRPIQTCYGCFYFSWIPFFDWNRFGETCETNSFGGVLVISELTRWELGLRAVLEYKF